MKNFITTAFVIMTILSASVSYAGVLDFFVKTKEVISPIPGKIYTVPNEDILERVFVEKVMQKMLLFLCHLDQTSRLWK